MQPKHNISRYKQKLLIFLSALFIALILQPTQIVHADPYIEWATALVHSDGSSGGGANDKIQNGVTYTRTGYLAYLLTADGATTGHPAIAFYSPGFEYLSGYEWITTSRRGHTVTSFEGGAAPWGCTPWTPSGSGSTVFCTTNEPQIKAWFQNMNNGGQNCVQFVFDNWGEDAATHFYNNEYIIVIETLMHFQYSVKDGSAVTDTYIRKLAKDLVDKTYFTPRPSDKTGDLARRVLSAANRFDIKYSIGEFMALDSNMQTSILNQIRASLIEAVRQVYAELYADSTGREYVGPPLIGTVPNLIEWANKTPQSLTVFDSYLNNVAPSSEYAIADGVAERAGFIVHPGPFNVELSDDIVCSRAVAMMIITANTTAQTTCDEPLIPSPHDPPKESDGKITIVKSYREKINGEEKHVATTSRSNLGTQIIIENEQTYQVVGWKTSTTTNTGITSTPWNPPSSVIQQGTTPKSVTLQPTETCLYVLLEKVEEEPPEEEDYNYLLSESSITRTVWFSNPDHNKLGNMNNPEWIYDHKFNWASPATPYCEGHPYKGACLGNHEGEHTSSCPKGCPSTCNLPSPHIHEEACDSHHYWNCGSNDCDLNNQTAKCSGTPEWVDQALTLTITNTKQNSYPDILATKEGWNAEVREGGIIKHYYRNDSKFDRLSKSTQTYTDNGWDYVCILMRGKDKLTLAEWQNYGQGNNAGNA